MALLLLLLLIQPLYDLELQPLLFALRFFKPKLHSGPPNSLPTVRQLGEVVEKFFGREFLIGHGANLSESHIGLRREGAGQDNSLASLTSAEGANQIRLRNKGAEVIGHSATKIVDGTVPRAGQEIAGHV